MAIVVNRKEKRELIYNAALQAFSEKGFHETTISEVAQIAGISKGAIYDYFSSKEELFLELSLYLLENFRDSYAKRVSSLSLEPEERIEEFISLSISETKETGNLFLIFLESWLEISKKDNRNPIILKLRRTHNNYKKMLSSHIKEGIKAGKFKEDINPDHLATIILAAVDGLAIHWLSTPRAFSLNQMKESLITMILNGMKKG